ncbi:hypothetical protein [Aliivibrio fischeri]|uniref:hypothetical protein n=1 Tax=Aliivibrio fischeri TaxID=668 RepID=UPI00084BE4C0|nr:hypothetical protein [Aliivibrio fischeri]OED51082.1 hypothetical protein BEI47_10595 [Aliivibrio fischeri]
MNTEKFWSLWDLSLQTTISLGLCPSFGPDFEFRGTNNENTEQIKNIVYSCYSEALLVLESMIDRNSIINNCTGMSYLMHSILKHHGISSIIVTGGYTIDKVDSCEVTSAYIVNQLKKEDDSPLALHSWLLLENFLLVDPTILLKYSLRNEFLNNETIGEPFVMDIEELPKELNYTPHVLGFDYLVKIGAIAI